jgi:hypothetical protein
MNKRIKELATEARLLTGWPVGEVEYQKFAELIVRECAKVAWYHTPDTEELEYGHLIGDKILKRFGVEE